jgi:hypothetical protein
MAVEAFGLDDVARGRNAAARPRKRVSRPIEIADVLEGLRGGTIGSTAPAAICWRYRSLRARIAHRAEQYLCWRALRRAKRPHCSHLTGWPRCFASRSRSLSWRWLIVVSSMVLAVGKPLSARLASACHAAALIRGVIWHASGCPLIGLVRRWKETRSPTAGEYSGTTQARRKNSTVLESSSAWMTPHPVSGLYNLI